MKVKFVNFYSTVVNYWYLACLLNHFVYSSEASQKALPEASQKPLPEISQKPLHQALQKHFQETDEVPSLSKTKIPKEHHHDWLRGQANKEQNSCVVSVIFIRDQLNLTVDLATDYLSDISDIQLNR